MKQPSFFTDWFLPKEVLSDLQRLRHGRLLVAICLLALTVEPFFALRQFFVMHNTVAGWLTVGLAALGIAVLVFIRRGGSLALATHAICVDAFIVTFGISLSRGGFILAPIVPTLLIPLVLALLGERAGAKIWCALIALHYSVLAGVTHFGFFGLERKTAFDYPQMMGYLFLTTAIALVYDSSRRVLESEKEELARQLRSTERLEALGHLAAGVSHDFNNLLTVFMAAGESLKSGLPLDHPLRADSIAILEAAGRGSAITKRLLAFSRRDAAETSVFDARKMLTGLLTLLRGSLPTTIVMRISPAADRCWVRADRDKLEWVVLNLIVNARDAMPRGGTLELGVRCTRGETDDDRVVLSVRDTGAGIDADVLPHIFEPFFTTKRRGQGTGLGLATAYGDVRAMGGDIHVESQPGKGSLFEVALARVAAPPPGDTAAQIVAETDAAEDAPRVGEAQPPAASGSPPGIGTVLVVDDQPQVVRAARRVLSAAGFRVLEAHDGAAALDLVRTKGDTIDLVLTDVVMPGMGGLELAKSVRELHARTPIIFMSGYSDDPDVRREVDGRRAQFLHKPFENRELVREVSEAISSRSHPTEHGAGA